MSSYTPIQIARRNGDIIELLDLIKRRRTYITDLSIGNSKSQADSKDEVDPTAIIDSISFNMFSRIPVRFMISPKYPFESPIIYYHDNLYRFEQWSPAMTLTDILGYFTCRESVLTEIT